jgi:integrase
MPRREQRNLVLSKHVVPQLGDWRLRDIGNIDVQHGWPTSSVNDKAGRRFATPGAALRHPRDCGRVRLPVDESGTRSEVSGAGRTPGTGVIAGDDFAKLLNQLAEPYRTMVEVIAATGLMIGELLAARWRALDLEIGTLTVRESVFEGKFQRPMRRSPG